MGFTITVARSARMMALVGGLACVAAAQAQTSNGVGVNVTISPLTGYATFVSTKEAPASVAGHTGAAQDPRIFLAQYGPLMGITDPGTQLVQTGQIEDRIGHVHTTYAQVFANVPVFGGEVKVHQKGGAFVALNGTFFPITPTLNATPTIAADSARTIALAAVSMPSPVFEESRLVVVDPGWYGNRRTGPRLAYYIAIADRQVVRKEAVLVDAHNAAVLDRLSLIASARDRRIYNAGSIYSLKPNLYFNPFVSIPTGPQVKLSRWEGRPPTGIKDVDQAYDYAGDAYDYFVRAFHRDGLDGHGVMTRSVVLHRLVVGEIDKPRPACDNALGGLDVKKDPMTDFCPGWAFDDMVVHELTHAITFLTANLVYANQSGQLNESFSDVFGELVDLFNGNAAFAGDPNGPPLWPTPAGYVGPGSDFKPGPGPSSGNQKRHACSPAPGYPDGFRWLLGEDVRGEAVQGAIRDMWDPTCFQHPDFAQSTYYTCGGTDDAGGVHIGSSVPNHAFALLTDGTKNFLGWEINGIGPVKAGAVWYRALTTYMTSMTDFKTAYDQFTRAADDLIWTLIDDPRTAAATELFSADDAEQVGKALAAVGMGVDVPCPWPLPTPPTLTAVLPPSSAIVTLNWTDNYPQLRSFRIEAKVGAAGSYAVYDTVPAAVRSYTFDISALPSSTVVFFRVTATEIHGVDSAPSNEASVTVP